MRILVRDPKRISDLDAEPFTGDLRNLESLKRAVAGCNVVYHIAADYRLWARHESDLFRSNVDGTRNMMEAARGAGVERVVYTSTVGCIGIPENGKTGDENSPVSLAVMRGAYKRSKFLAEEVALEFARSGLPVVIVNPTAPIGDHDTKPTPTGRIVVDFLNRKMPAYLDTGLNVVPVSDVAEGHLLACEKGRPGERYILGSENLTLQDIFRKLERISGIQAPTVRIPYAVAYGAGMVSTAWANLSGEAPRAPLDAVRMAKKKMWVTHDKATRELGFHPGGADSALESGVAWFTSNGYVA